MNNKLTEHEELGMEIALLFMLLFVDPADEDSEEGNWYEICVNEADKYQSDKDLTLHTFWWTMRYFCSDDSNGRYENAFEARRNDQAWKAQQFRSYGHICRG